MARKVQSAKGHLFVIKDEIKLMSYQQIDLRYSGFVTSLLLQMLDVMTLVLSTMVTKWGLIIV